MTQAEIYASLYGKSCGKGIDHYQQMIDDGKIR